MSDVVTNEENKVVEPKIETKVIEKVVEREKELVKDEHGNIVTNEGKFYTQSSVDEFQQKLANENKVLTGSKAQLELDNKRLHLHNKMLTAGVNAEVAEQLSQAIDPSKIDEFDYSKFVSTDNNTKVQPKVPGSPEKKPEEEGGVEKPPSVVDDARKLLYKNRQ